MELDDINRKYKEFRKTVNDDKTKEKSLKEEIE